MFALEVLPRTSRPSSRQLGLHLERGLGEWCVGSLVFKKPMSLATHLAKP